MLKKSLYIENPCYLNVRNEQLIISKKDSKSPIQRSIEDLGFVILDHAQITLSMGVMQKMAEHNVSVIFCDVHHLPSSMILPLDNHHTQSQHFQFQVEAKEPLKKQLWQQVVKAKIKNQAAMLDVSGGKGEGLLQIARGVKSGDTTNQEARASRFYWPNLFGDAFLRRRFGLPPNHFLNYGYAVLRAAIARALVGAGLLPTLGIHHRNKYNAFCLADDLMEPFRPFVDFKVWELWERGETENELETRHKVQLLEILTADVLMGEKMRPLMNAASQTAVSLAKCYKGEIKKLSLPQL